jgi:hypothetical protein
MSDSRIQRRETDSDETPDYRILTGFG